MNKKEALKVLRDYEARFGSVPLPMCIDSEDIADALLKHMEKGLPDDYDWYADLPPGCDAGPEIK